MLPGTIILYGSAAPPTGYLPCDGAAVSRSTYGALFAVLGETFGAGDGTTTFNVPDLRGRVPVGQGAGTGLTPRALADQVGAETHQLAATEIPAHTHTATQAQHRHAANVLNSFVGAWTGTGQYLVTAAAPPGVEYGTNATTAFQTPAITVQNAGGGGAHNNMQPSLGMGYYIKT